MEWFWNIDLFHWSAWATLYYVAEWAARLAMLCWVPMKRSPEAAKGWLLLIFFLPSVGIPLYWLIGRPYVPRWRRERMARLQDDLMPLVTRLRDSPNIVHPQLPAPMDQAVNLARNLGRLPILGGNDAELLPDYQGSIDRLAADIDAARHHVHLLYYIFAVDESTRPVLDALARAQRRGVVCRVLVDSLGSRKLLRALLPSLEAAAVQVRQMLRVGIFRRYAARTDLRNHRKIAVIDGRIAYTGSQNLISATFKPGITYEEMVVRVTGPVALGLQYVFVGDWYLETEEVLDSREVFPEPETTGTVAAQVLPSGPTFAAQGNQRVVIALLFAARRRIVMTTPYFIPDAALQNALQIAAQRGVEVHLVVSEMEDQFLVGHAQKSYYEELLEAGVRIHLFQKHFLHAKHLTIDDEVSMIGSSNMDIRSFVLNAEISLLLYDRGVTAKLAEEQARTFRRSRELTAQEWARRGFVTRLVQNLARLMSPLL